MGIKKDRQLFASRAHRGRRAHRGAGDVHRQAQRHRLLRGHHPRHRQGRRHRHRDVCHYSQEVIENRNHWL